MRRTSRGYTLVELIAAVAIFSVLLMCLVPVMDLAKRRAADHVCANNLMDLFRATEMYTSRHGGWVPPQDAYRRGSGNAAGYVDRWGANQPARLYFAGCLALESDITEGRTLACPGTVALSPRSNVRARLLAASPQQWAKEPEQHCGLSGNYGLRWSGRKDKVYPGRRLMMAEAAGAWGAPRALEIEQHGGRYTGQGERGGMSMNVAASDGTIAGVRHWTDTRLWIWGDRYYYPFNDRTGDAFVTRYAFDPQEPDPSGGTQGFWSSFDRELFDGERYPWGDTPESPLNW